MTGSPDKTAISIEVAYATAERQEVVSLDLEQGLTVRDAIDRSGLAEMFENFAVDGSRVGIFSRKVTLDQVLHDGDRVEVYRPLQIDPKEARRQRAISQNGD